MVLLFLRDWRTRGRRRAEHPAVALLRSLVGLWLTGQTINLMTLGGLALAVGILVDEATVEVENIHTQMRDAPASVAAAVGSATRRRPCPACWPCSASWPCSSRRSSCRGRPGRCSCRCRWRSASPWSPLHSVQHVRAGALSVWLLQHHGEHGVPDAWTLLRSVPASPLLVALLASRWRWLVGGLPGGRGWSRALAGAAARSGTEIFPEVDAGQFQLRLRRADRHAHRADRGNHPARRWMSSEEVGPDNVDDLARAIVGVVPSSYPINTIYLWMGGPEEAVMRVALKPGSGCGRRIEGPAARGTARATWRVAAQSKCGAGRLADGTDRANACAACGCPSSRPTSSTK